MFTICKVDSLKPDILKRNYVDSISVHLEGNYDISSAFLSCLRVIYGLHSVILKDPENLSASTVVFQRFLFISNQ